MRPFLLLLIILILPFSIVFSASDSGFRAITSEEDLAEELSNGNITSQQYEELLEMIREKININSDEIDELKKIPGITEGDIISIRVYRNQLGGNFSSIDEVKNIVGLDYEKIQAFIKIEEFKISTYYKKNRYDIFKSQSGGSIYIQSVERLAEDSRLDNEIKLRYNYGKHFTAYSTLVQELNDPVKVETRYLMFKNLSFIKKAVIGNYKAIFGEGLVVGGTFNLSASYLNDYIESLETFDGKAEKLVQGTYFDGLYLENRMGFVKPTFFLSIHRKSSISKPLFNYKYEFDIDDTTKSNASFEINDRVIGGNIDMEVPKIKNLVIGTTYLHSELDTTNSFYTSDVKGIHQSFNIGFINVFSEYAKISNAGDGFIIGGQVRSKVVTFKYSYRDYDTDFLNFYSRGFSDSDGDDNDSDERGFYLETSSQILPKVNLYGYYDQWWHPSDLITSTDKRFRLDLPLFHNLSFEFDNRFKDVNVDLKGETKWTSASEITYKLNKKIALSFRGNYNENDTGKDIVSGGYLWGKVKYIPFPLFEFESRIRYYDSDFQKYANGYYESYLQQEVNFWGTYNFLIRYTALFYEDKNKDPNNIHTIRVKLTARY